MLNIFGLTVVFAGNGRKKEDEVGDDKVHELEDQFISTDYDEEDESHIVTPEFDKPSTVQKDVDDRPSHDVTNREALDPIATSPEIWNEIFNEGQPASGIRPIAAEEAEKNLESSPSIVMNGSTSESVNSDSGGANETKPLRTNALCTMLTELVEAEEGLEVLSLEDHEDDESSNGNTQPQPDETPKRSSSMEQGRQVGDTKISSLGVVTGHEDPSVKLVNVTELVQDVLWSNNSIKSRLVPANCSIVLFYASWCPFSAKAAPHFNALPRAFPSLRVAAIDTTTNSAVNSYFGILSVPTVLLFHNGKSIAKFNESFTLNKFAEFIHTHTDLRSDANINVTSQDFAGPLPSVPTHAVDFYLIFAWIFIIVCFFYNVTKSALWRKAIDVVRTTWREAEDHVHQD